MANHSLFTVNLKDATFKVQEMKKPRIILSDDGTLDTVLICQDCKEEMRYNFQACGSDDETYDEFVKWSIWDCEEEHECDENQETSLEVR